IGLVGMVVDADVLDRGIDLDRIDALHAEAQGVRQVVAGAGADDHDVLERRAAAVLLQQMDQRIGRAAFAERHHFLMADAVDGDFAALLVEVDGVVRRPADVMVAGTIGVESGKSDHEDDRHEAQQRQRLVLI
ncbi:hypothetical protein CEE95_14840, partial [Lactobacillus crispatus]